MTLRSQLVVCLEKVTLHVSCHPGLCLEVKVYWQVDFIHSLKASRVYTSSYNRFDSFLASCNIYNNTLLSHSVCTSYHLFITFCPKPLSGNALQKQPVSSTLQMWSGWCMPVSCQYWSIHPVLGLSLPSAPAHTFSGVTADCAFCGRKSNSALTHL